MKKRIYLLAGALCIIMQLVSSCTNFLEVEEKGKTTIPSFLSDPDGLNAGLVEQFETTVSVEYMKAVFANQDTRQNHAYNMRYMETPQNHRSKKNDN